MRRTFWAIALCALSIFALPESKAAEVSIDFFYNNLSGGSWIDAGDYGYGWQPDVAVNDPEWRPYADGYWAYTDYGWTWISYEDFGWATYHYGRWARLTDYGWVWFPGSDLEWGPAWVSWRFGGDYCGWAPLPPRGPGIVYEGSPIGSHVDIEFDIGPAYYNFIDLRYIGEPVLRSHIYAPSYNVTYINQTVNVTNITVQNNVVYNYGPDYNVLAQHSARPIQRLTVEREQNIDVAAAAKTGGLTKVQGNKLIVAAPPKIQKPSKQIAPPQVKTKIPKEKVVVQHGWSEAGDQKAQQQLKEKIKTENPKNIPPPTRSAAGARPSPGTSGASGAATRTPGIPTPVGAASPVERGKKGKRGELQPGITPQVSPGYPTRSGSPAFTPANPERGKGKGKREEPFATPSGGTTPRERADIPLATPRQPVHGRGPRPEFTPPAGDSTTAPENARKSKHREAPERVYQTPGVLEQRPSQGAAGPQHEHQAQQGMRPAETGPAGPNPQERGPKHQMEGGYPPQSAPPKAHTEHGQPEGGKKQKGEKESPPPG